MKKTKSHFNMYVDAKQIKIDDNEDSVRIVIPAKILEASDFHDRIQNTVTIHNKNIIQDLQKQFQQLIVSRIPKKEQTRVQQQNNQENNPSQQQNTQNRVNNNIENINNTNNNNSQNSHNPIQTNHNPSHQGTSPFSKPTSNSTSTNPFVRQEPSSSSYQPPQRNGVFGGANVPSFHPQTHHNERQSYNPNSTSNESNPFKSVSSNSGVSSVFGVHTGGSGGSRMSGGGNQKRKVHSRGLN